ncbi:MAG: aminoacyltransferase [Candidatus Nomurabacteria bacterium]|jgi:lipid II:glycine glycyltransferase (peptidoglycan interpeptide bridge formation enzyme)|nr:aminoacyltransferase [Candidatus Nomurabacteria bacterium]
MNNSQKWNFLVESQNGHPLQLFGWGEVKKHTGVWQVLHIVRASEATKTNSNPANNAADQPAANFAQILIRKTPLGSFGYIPRGPNINDNFLQELRTVAKRENLFMLRFEPNVKAENWQNQNFKHPKDHILLNHTVQLDLTKSPETLLAEMDSGTRQNIRRGERNAALNIRPATAEDLPRILAIYHETATRSHFPLHPDDYYHTIYKKMGQHNHIFVAEITDPETHQKQVESFVWCIKTPAICFELYGGGTSLALKHRANYLLKWHAILAAKETCKTYDINGLLNDGISDFKRGFSSHQDGHATETVLAPTSDLVLKPLNYFLFTTLLPIFKKLHS